jgi:hypothetical protein
MMDQPEDRLDHLLRDAARDYNAPPPTPKAELWERIQAGRRQAKVTPLRRSVPWSIPLAAAALIALGIAVGRMTVSPVQSTSSTAPTMAQAPEARDPGRVAARMATADHLSQAETFLTEFGTRLNSADFTSEAQDLLMTTRLLLDSKRVVDPGTRTLLEDLELALAQIATLDPKGHGEDLNFIADGLAQSHLRTRLRNAIPSGPAIRL